MDRPDDWVLDGACRPGATYLDKPVDPDWWFPASSDRGGQMGRFICRTHCAVSGHCLSYAQEHELQGVWGGQGEQERYGHVVHSKPRMEGTGR